MGYDIGMGKKQKLNKIEWRLYLGLAVVIAVVLGVFLVALTAYDGREALLSDMGDIVEEKDGTPQKPAVHLLVASGSEAYILNARDLAKRALVWPEDVALLGEPLSQISGVDCATGQPSWLNPGFVQASSSMFRSPDGRREARLNTEKRSAGNSVLIQYGNSVNSLVLRLRDGRRIIDPRILGWLNKDEILLAGKSTSTLTVYSLNLSGDVSRWSYLPPDTMSVGLHEGKVYYVRPVGASDVEPSTGGSSVWRAYKDKPHERLLTDQDHMIEQVFFWERGLVFAAEQDELFIFSADNSKPAGRGRLLLSIGQEGWLVNREGSLYLLDHDGQQTALGLSEECSVFNLPKIVLDKEVKSQ